MEVENAVFSINIEVFGVKARSGNERSETRRLAVSDVDLSYMASGIFLGHYF